MHITMANREKISQFRAATKTDQATAQSILADNGWDVAKATSTYRFMEQAAIPPPGPLKNVEPKLVPSATSSSVTAASNTASSGVTASASVTAASNVGRPQGGATTVNGLQGAAASMSFPNTLTYKLKRGLSKTSENFPLVNKARDVVLQDISEGSTERSPHFIETPEYTFMLPNLSQYPDDFRAFLHKDLIETSTLVSLEQAGRLNWWADLGACQRLLPLATTGDGNCLLHAASLGMWGFHDRLLTLRRALYSTLNSDLAKGEFWRRWRLHQSQVNKQSGLIYSEVEWEKEWANLLKLASFKPRGLPQNNGGDNTASTNRQPDLSCDKGGATGGGEENEVSYESLEEFHVFVLAYILRRPIIIVADTILKDSNGEALAPIPFGGIYLPFQCPPQSCHRSPLLLTYDAAHFSALVAMEQVDNVLPAAIPMVDPDFSLLPIHFMLDPGPNYNWSKEDDSKNSASNVDISLEDKLKLIGQYLDIKHVPLPSALNNATASTSKPDSDSSSSQSSSITSAGGAMLPPAPPGVVRTASVDSNDSTKSTQSMKERDGNSKDKDRRKPAKQKVSITFGSLGRTMSKKLKNLGKGGAAAAKQAAADKKEAVARESVAPWTPTTRTSSLTADMLKDREHIVCAKLLHKRLEYQQEMVNNYLTSALERFKTFDHYNQQLRREREAKVKQEDEVDGQSPVQCINQGCGRQGTAATSYLCDECYRQQKQEALSLASLAKTGGGTDSGKSAGLPRQDTMVTLSQSKFYTMSSENHSLSRPKYMEEEKNTYNGELNNIQVPLRERQMPLGDFSRSSFPVESHSMHDMNAPHGTAVIVNNLHDEKLYHTLPPKLRADLKADGCVIIPDKSRGLHSRSAAFKVKNTDAKVLKHFQPSDEKYVARAQCGVPSGVRLKCRNRDCEFFGSEGNDFLCSQCFREKQRVAVFKAEKTKKS